MSIGASIVYTVSSTVYHICSNVVKPRKSPNVELAVNTATSPVDGTVKVYSSLRESIGRIASDEILLAFPAFSDRISRKDLSTFAPCNDGRSDAPRPTTNRPSLSFFKYERVRSAACCKSSGASCTCILILNELLRMREVFPVCSERGIGHRHVMPGIYVASDNDSTKSCHRREQAMMREQK